jgi:hypothetical protein
MRIFTLAFALENDAFACGVFVVIGCIVIEGIKGP